MTINGSATIALSFCMIIFPTFIIVPSAFAIYKRTAEFWFTAVHATSFGIAALSLIIAVVYTGIALFSICSAVTLSLGIVMILVTIGILLFLRKLQQWLWELALVEIISEAEATELE